MLEKDLHSLPSAKGHEDQKFWVYGLYRPVSAWKILCSHNIKQEDKIVYDGEFPSKEDGKAGGAGDKGRGF